MSSTSPWDKSQFELHPFRPDPFPYILLFAIMCVLISASTFRKVRNECEHFEFRLCPLRWY
jgi:hypothetical protein